MVSYYQVSGTGRNSAYTALSRSADDEGGVNSNWLTSNHYRPAAPHGQPEGFKSYAGHSPQNYYDFVCLDRDDEVLARIRVTVREWNTLADLKKYRAGDNTGIPDQGGTEPNSGGLYNDWVDWDDVTIASGGFPLSQAVMNLGGGALMEKMTPELY